MKLLNLTLFTFYFLLIGLTKAQLPFEKTYLNNQNIQGTGVYAFELSTGEYILAMENALVKTDINGNILGNLRFSSFNFEPNFSMPYYDNAIVELNNGNILLAGGSGWIVVDPNTMLPINLPTFSTPLNNLNNTSVGTQIRSISKKTNGEIVMLGTSDLALSNVPHPAITTLNPDGTFLSHKQLTNPYYIYNPPNWTTQIEVSSTNIEATSDGGYLVCGSSSEYNINNASSLLDLFVIKYDNNDNISWQFFYGEQVLGFDEAPNDIIELSNGDFLISSILHSTGNNSGGSAGLIRIDNLGNVIWSKKYFRPNTTPDPNRIVPGGIIEKNVDEIYLVGNSAEIIPNGSVVDAVLLNINSNTGNINFANAYPNAFSFNGINKTSTNNFLITGAPPVNPQKEWSTLLKTDINAKTGCEKSINIVSDTVLTHRHIAEFSGNNLGAHVTGPVNIFTGTNVTNRCCVTTVDITGDSVICPNSSTTLDAGTGYASYLWSPSGQTSQQINVTTPGTYIVNVVDSNGCNATDSIIINTVSGPPTPKISGNTVACGNGTFTITNCQPGVTYIWNVTNGTPATSTGCSTTINWTSPNLGGTINISAIDSNGCDVKVIYTIYECCEPTTGINIVNTTTSALQNNPPMVTNNITNGLITTYRATSPSNRIGINGTLTVDNDFIIDDAHIELGPDAMILIKDGATLTIESESFLRACSDKLWNSIFIEPLGQLIIRDSRFEDAKQAVHSSGGGYYFIDNATFKNNHTGIYVDKYFGDHPGVVIDSKFNSNGFLLSPFNGERSKFGIEVNQVGDANGGDLVIGAPSAGKNLFKDLNVGIHGINSNLKIYNNRFSDILPIPFVFNLSPIVSIWLEGENQFNTLLTTTTIGGNANNEKNIFVNCERGIYANKNMNLNVINNRLVTIKKTGIEANNFFKLLSASNINIIKNDVINAGIGISLLGSAIPKTVIQQNRLINMTFGQQIGIRCWDAFNSPFIPTNTLIANNKIRNAALGIDLIRYKSGTIRDNTVRDIANNTPTNPSFGIKVQASQNITLNNNTVRQVSASTANTFGISIRLSENILTTCNTTRQTEVGIQVAGPSPGTAIHQNTFRDNTTGFLLSNNGFMDDQFRGTIANKLPSDNKWVGSFTWATEVVIGSNNPISTFYIKPNGVFNFTLLPNVGSPLISTSFISGSPGLCVAIPPPPTPLLKQITLGNVGNTADEIAIAEASLYNKLQLDTNMLNDIDYSNFNNTCNTADFGTLMHTNNALANPNATNLTTQLAQCQATTPNTNPSINLKEVALIGLNNRINNTQLNISQISTLQVLAAKCPFTDGIAVYQARALLAPVDTTVYYNYCESYYPNGNNERIGNTNNLKSSEVSIYPNPTNNLLHIKSDATVVSVQLLTIEGKLLKQINNSKIINVSSLTKGIYFIKIKTSQNSFIKKFIKQ